MLNSTAPVNKCLTLLVTSLGPQTALTCETLLPFLVEQIQQQRLCPNLYIISLLTLMQKVGVQTFLWA